MYRALRFFALPFLASCSFTDAGDETTPVAFVESATNDTIHIYTDTSSLKNAYSGFNSPKAINRVAEIENEYFNNYNSSFSKYYGTLWAENASTAMLNDSISELDQYKSLITKRGEKADSMHCTIYAFEALKAGLDTNYQRLEDLHHNVYNDHEHAGWSVGYILVKHFGWEAFLVLSKHSNEFRRCVNGWKKKVYPVWKQPDIPLSGMFDFEKDSQEIDSLLNLHEFGWGFSEQGWHTWITRFNELKECDWGGQPSGRYDPDEEGSLFKATKFTEYFDYNSHILIFPPKRDAAISEPLPEPS